MIALTVSSLPDIVSSVLHLIWVLAETSSDGPPAWLLVLGPAGAVGVYWALYRYYRNTDKSHQFERETLIEAEPVTGNDAKVDEVKGTQRSRIQGDNVRSFRARVQRLQ